MQSVTLSTLERRFRYKSSTSGDIGSAYNAGSLLAVLPFSYFAGRKGAAKLRYLALGLFIIGCGSVLFCLPHFISSPKKAQPVTGDDGMCRDGISLKNDLNDSSTEEPPYYLFQIFGHFLHGLGASVIYPVGVSYVLNNLADHPNFVAVWPSFGAFGHGAGLTLGAALLKIKSDIDQPTALLANEGDEQFGAWVS